RRSAGFGRLGHPPYTRRAGSQTRGGGAMPGSVIVAGARTPIGKLSGALSSLAAPRLGAVAIAAALARAGIEPGQVDYVFMGQVILAGAGQATARQAAAEAGIPLTV